MNISFNRRHEYVDASTGRKRTIPAGWSGALPDDIAEAAIAAGHATAAEITVAKDKKSAKKDAGAA